MLFAITPHLNPLPKGERKQSVNTLLFKEREQSDNNWEILKLDTAPGLAGEVVEL